MGHESLGYAAQQAKYALLEYRSEGMTASMPPSGAAPSDVRPRSEFLQDSDLNLDQWHEFHDIVNLDLSARQQELDDGTRTASEAQTSSVITQPSTANYLDNQGFMECTVPSTMVPYSSHSLPTTWGPQGANHASWAKLSRPPTYTTVSQDPPQEEASSGTCSTGSDGGNRSSNRRSSSKGGAQDMMSRILQLNMAMSQSIQKATSANRARCGDRGSGAGSILVDTLQHSGVFLEMMRELMSPGKAEPRTGDIQARAGSEETVGRSEKAKGGGWGGSNGPRVNMEVALQMLSCNMTIGALYQALTSELKTASSSSSSSSSSEAGPLPELRLEGLPNGLDPEMRVSLLAHICVLMFLKIQDEVARLHRQGFLSPMAQSTFEAVLAANRDKVAQTAESLRWISGGGSERAAGLQSCRAGGRVTAG
ncbi:hypothetical protein FJTKL_07792 [Diaporthe vaccinii]|uniref:Uncharacterized protein n=1 Tax=Diaporthe vaccinii TaxID=105482 RepID=A0ABR4FDC5_9PEZI